jgi:hypothetical protein
MHMVAYNKNRTARKPKTAENSASAGSKRRDPLAVYDGQRLLGTLIENEKIGLVLAWDAERKLLGRFCNAKAAADSISASVQAADARKAATQDALEQINRAEVEFASGLPADLVGGGRRR